MRARLSTAIAILVSLSLASPALAGQRPTRTGSKAAPKAAVSAPPPVAIAEVFAVATASERWSLDDPVPKQSVLFAGKPLSLEQRQVTSSNSDSGLQQMFFPVSWYPAYQPLDPDIKYVLVRYDGSLARTIVVEYVPERVAMPKAEFKFDQSGRRYYRDLAFSQQNGRMYVKQALSSGNEDGRGNLWVDSIVIYSVDDAGAASPAAAKATGRP